MCGITGILNFNNTVVTVNDIKIMTDSIAHRGPDGEGAWVKNNIGLGHRRLSIIDLSQSANQPMFSYDKRFVIVFNGEIYNYKELQKIIIKKGIKLKTNSDTEVLIYLYQLFGEKSLSMLRGMFAFAIWDNKKQEIFIARDRIGIKPLYFLKNKNQIIFASEIKAIASIHPNLTLNKNALFKYLRTSLFTDDDTVFSEIKCLTPGTFLKISKNNFQKIKYWELQTSFNKPILPISNKENLLTEFKNNFTSTINYHLVSDVPVGGFLSGGLDSSAVLAFMRQLKPKADIYTASVIFPDYPNNFNEEPFSDQVAKHLNTKHHKINFESNFINDMEEIAWYCDEPFGITSSYALYYLSKEVSKNVKVVLTGDGADELLAGYQGFLKNEMSFYYHIRHLLSLSSNIIYPFAKLEKSEKLFETWLKLKRKSGSLGFNFSENASYGSTLNFMVLNSDYIHQAWKEWSNNSISEYYGDLKNQSDIRKKLYASLKTRLVNEMLKKVDRMTMAHSLEARVPFLDHIFVEYSNTLPDQTKLFKDNNNKIQSKYFLRKISEDLLPNNIIYREKHGFNIPLDDWIKNDVSKFTDIATNGVLVKNNIIDKNRLLKIIIAHKQKNNDYSMLILNIITFEYWYKAYKNRIPNFSLSFN